MSLRLIFMGTPEFAVPSLLALGAAGHDIAAVYTRAPKPAGRGMDMQVTPIEREARRFADSRGVMVDWTQVSRLDDETLVNAISAMAPFDSAAKQALLEAVTLDERADLLAQFLGFFRRGDDDPATLQ